MAITIHQQIVAAFRAHWTAHGNKYPAKLVLTTPQLDEFLYQRTTGAVGYGGAEKPSRTSFWSTPIVEDPATPGVLVGVDGVEIPLQAPPAA